MQCLKTVSPHLLRCLRKAGDLAEIRNNVELRLFDLNGTEGRSDNRKCWIIGKANEEYDDKYQLSLTQFTILT